MKYLKTVELCLSAMVVAAGAMAAPAFALPDISITLGGSYPLQLEMGGLAAPTTLEDTSGEKLTGMGILLLLLANELTSLGRFEVLFDNVTAGKRKCATSGDKTGEVLASGTWHIVLGTSGAKKVLSTLFEPEEVKVTCPVAESEGELKVKVKGKVLSPFSEEGTETTEFTAISGKLEGKGAGKEAETKYLNAGGTEVTAQLLSNFGTGFLESSDVSTEEGNDEGTASESAGKMFVITGR